ncbi:MAG: response regulator [Gammaproteobacteria bacterium]|nr:MAG: response regulator [Gammaproteobacteria bacterium]
MTEKLITTRQAAEMLGVALRTVQLWVEAGALQAWKTPGGHRRIALSSVEKMLAERAEATGEALPGSRTQSPERDNQPTVLVVEDDQDLLALHKTHLEEWLPQGRILTAVNGFEGLLKIGEHKPDAIITDLSMPGMDGFKMLRSLEKNGLVKRSQVIVVTALSLKDIDNNGGLPAGVECFFKPVPFDALKKRVLAACKG